MQFGILDDTLGGFGDILCSLCDTLGGLGGLVDTFGGFCDIVGILVVFTPYFSIYSVSYRK